MKEYVRLLRVKHYIKNILVLVPLFFSQQMIGTEKFCAAIVAMLVFCMVASAIYVINDIRDVEKDRKHPTKCTRPLANGTITLGRAYLIVCVCVAAAGCLHCLIGMNGLVYIGIYFAINVLYSIGLKNIPIVDIAVLSSGYLIRILYGAAIANIEVSGWLYLCIITVAFFMSLGKRRGERELMTDGNTRAVLKSYTYDFLDKMLYVFLALTGVFYSLWAMEKNNDIIMWTIPVVFLIMMKYSLTIEGTSDGDPIEVILKDKYFILLGIIYVTMMFVALYLV